MAAASRICSKHSSIRPLVPTSLLVTYCWGEGGHIKTTRDTYMDHIRQIPMTSMPPTFRDAVIISRHLGIRYLWIDSLCIVQDSVEDWGHNCANMGAIYAGSFLTINESGAKNSQGGLFNDQTKSDVVSCSF